MEKNYDHKAVEDKLYKQWEESGAFTPPAGDDLSQDRKTYTIIMPPPNANDPLHVGHACFITIEDVFVRYRRMMGDASLWLPGTDHAGIETQYLFEKKLAKEDKSRFDYDRDTLFSMIWDYVQKNSGIAMDQMKKLGASADWTRYKFTLDEDIVRDVLNNFVELNKRGLIYKAERLVNYCTKCGTAYSELEVEYEEREDKIYTIDYGKGIRVATTRPETLLGDVAVAVNPLDERYTDLVGKELELPLTNRIIPVIADESVDMEFGTGAVKITPTHDRNDWEVAERQKMDLPYICLNYKIIGENGKLTEKAGVYQGLSVNAAREKIITDLSEKLVETKPLVHNVATCYRCHRVIEPMPKSQFFIKVGEMAKKVLRAMDNNEVEIIGSGHDKVLRHWLNNLRDWNISRQIVWGIRMPVWYKSGEDYKVSIESPGKEWVQETDTFDTWFSSGQWPFVTLKNSKNGDFDKYYPTNLMETAYDILPFWVMRMLMLGIELTGEVPFKKVYLHGLVRDEKGDKMSKSKGNVMNPLVLSEKYGTDALRMALIMSTAPGVDSNTGENKVRGMRNFANKIWNAGRYIQDKSVVESKTLEEDKDFNKYLKTTTEEVSKLLNENKIGLASELVYQSFWHEYCDIWIEKHRSGVVSDKVMVEGYRSFLKLLHPFVPFVTEAVWQEVFPSEGLLISQSWPSES